MKSLFKISFWMYAPPKKSICALFAMVPYASGSGLPCRVVGFIARNSFNCVILDSFVLIGGIIPAKSA
ncbi:hypothetical protein D3C86_2197640 [compost metagenome]